MQLKDIFLKEVNRPIDGVIKADDDASLRTELEEYVLTNEASKRLESFFDAYNNYKNANGVWVSGFFGSGKSHLLKMLALVLENREVEDTRALDLFLPKVKGNMLLEADLLKAVAIPSKSILFNIDQKADVISKTEIDALLAVFVKVFDESCGYYGKHAYIANFERNLDQDGLFESFKAKFQELESDLHDWDWGRSRTSRLSSQIDDAFNFVTGQKVVGVLDKYRADYSLSIEDFANQISNWLEKQPKNFHLNFFVDEVGQYVAENTKLMTNLQTIAESLATKCKGQAWVIVTAQEDMDTVVGEMSAKQSNDFSKIQARFANRMKLTSTDVAEVIQKRLLAKNQLGQDQLTKIYNQQSNNFKTLFDFADGAQSYRNFKDADHFVNAYPFIPYHFDLFQAAIQSISAHNGFEGKHSSVGERSMLGVFREVAIEIAEQPVGQLATFDLMFGGIRTSLKSAIQASVQQAEKNLGDPYAVRILKTLFLVKYVKEFKSTLRNISVLMLDQFGQDIPELKKKIEAALNLLEQQTYIQRNGDLYEYLTDEEKDIEQDIKNTEIESRDVADKLENLVFDHIIKHRKIRYGDQGHDYPFTRKMDDRTQGREYELAIHIITPFSENSGNETIQAMQSMGKDELRVVLPEDEQLVRDILMYKRTEKYIRLNVSMSQQETVKRVLSDKATQNQLRESEITDRLSRLLSQAKLIVNSGDVSVQSEDAQSRILKGFHQLIEYSYPNLRMLRNIVYSENDIGKYLKHSQQGLLGNDATNLTEVEQELLSFIQSNTRGGVRTTVKSLLEKFERKPYGWFYAATMCNLALLCARGKLEVRVDSNLIEEDDLERTLRNTHGHGNVILEPQIEFTASQVRALKEFYAEFFDAPAKSTEAKTLAKETVESFKELKQKLAEMYAQSAIYPYLGALKPVLETFSEIIAKNTNWFITELPKQEESLHALKEQLINPLRKFMSSPQKTIYEEASQFIQEQEDNFGYIQGDELALIKATLTDPNGYIGNRLQEVKTSLVAIQQKIQAQHKLEIENAAIQLEQLKIRIQNAPEFIKIGATQQQELLSAFDQQKQSIVTQKRIAMIRDQYRQFEDQKYPQLLANLQRWASPPIEIQKPLVSDGSVTKTTDDHTEVAVKPVQPQIIAARSIFVDFDKVWLADKADVDRYLEQVRKAWLKEIEAGKQVQV